jgi:nitroreductase
MDIAEIKEKIVSAMVLAPSAHNTQPWRFVVTENKVDMLVDWSRHLRVSDPTQRELFVSLGCAVTNGLVAAAHAGHHVNLVYFPDGDGKDSVVARFLLTSGRGVQQVAALYPAVTRRRTNRHPYNGRPLTSRERTALTSRQEDEVFLVEKQGPKEALADVSAQGTEQTLAQPDFKEELSHWVRHNWTRQADGMPGYAMLMPAPISLISRFMVRLMPIHKQQAKKVKQQVMSSSAVAVVATLEDSKKEWLKTGQLLERLWLEATSAGLAASPIAAAIEAGNETRLQVQRILKTNLKPQALLRIGRAAKQDLRPTPRRTVADTLSKQ